MLTSTGIADNDLIQRCLPSPSRRASGPYPMIECFQEIPCNPCSTSCPFHAILPMDSIHDIPVLDFEKCTGCGACARVCPGLAIFIIDESRKDGTGLVTLPYEFSPLPKKGEIVSTMDRAGCVIGEGTVVRASAGRTSGTPLVTINVPIEQVHDVRFFCSKQRADRFSPANAFETTVDMTIVSVIDNDTELDNEADTVIPSDTVIPAIVEDNICAGKEELLSVSKSSDNDKNECGDSEQIECDDNDKNECDDDEQIECDDNDKNECDDSEINDRYDNDIDMDDDEAIICRCEGITRREIRELIAEGYTTVDEIKRISRAGMGPCQSRTCGPLIADEIARMTGQTRDSIQPSTHRPPVVAQPISFFTGGDDE